MNELTDRAAVFIDGNNWFHSLRDSGLRDLGRLNYARVAHKLVGPRVWVSTRYYIGQVPQTGNLQLYADQRRFLAILQSWDKRISVHLARIESRVEKNQAAKELRRYLGELTVQIDQGVFKGLMAIATAHEKVVVMVEKAADVHLAVDMVMMAQRDEYETAYLLSADGDLTPAVSSVRAFGKKVFVVSPRYGAQLAAVASAYIRLKPEWFSECFGR